MDSFIQSLKYCLVVFAVAALAASRVIAADEVPIGPTGERTPYPEILNQLREIPLQAIADSEQPANVTIEELFVAQKEWQKSIRSVTTEFVCTFHQVTSPGDIEAAIEFGTPLVSFRATYAESDAMQRSSYADLLNEASERYPDGEVIRVYDGQWMQQYQPGTMSGSIQRQAAKQIGEYASVLFEMVGMPIGQERILATPSRFWIASALQHEEYQVKSTLELVDGAPCYRVSTGPDTLWLDAQKGFALRRRVWFRTASKEDPGVLQSVYTLKEFVETGGVWIPTEMYRLDYATQEQPGSRRGMLQGVYHLSADIDLNSTKKEEFEFRFPDGTFVTDLDAKKHFFMPKGSDATLDRLVKDASVIEGVTIANPPVTPPVTPPLPLKNSGRFRVLLACGSVFLLAALSILLWWRDRKRKE